jgi:hypothetical protein
MFGILTLSTYPSTLFAFPANSTLCPRDRDFPYRNRIPDWGTSEFHFRYRVNVFSKFEMCK